MNHKNSLRLRFKGIDPELVQNLKYIVEQTGAKIILTSTWKYYWDHAGTPGMEEVGQYLNRALGQAGLTISARTEDMGYDRGQGIIDFLTNNPAKAWVVLDDEFFVDYKKFNIQNHLVLTSEKNGLTRELAAQAIQMMM